MIDLDRITGFEWDAGNLLKNEQKHGVTPAEAEQVFLNDPLLLSPDRGHSQWETRFHALGRTDDGRFLHLTFTLRDDRRLIRVISARPMSRRERMHYAKEA